MRSENQMYDRIRQVILNTLEIHKDEIERGDLNWFSVKIYLNGGNLRGTWQQEEKEKEISQE
jgi:coenzyme F420-reducing hydrogenase beta subunit